jgi:hypothetical protein
MPPVGFEPAIPASEQPQTHILDRADTGIGIDNYTQYNICVLLIINHIYLENYMK